MEKNKILIICGPTATGKTDLAIRLATKIDGELVSADSRQIYKGMDIGTGKDLPKFQITCLSGPLSREVSRQANFKFPIKYKKKIYNICTYEINKIPLWLYDVVSPDEEFSVFHYRYIAHSVLDHIWERNRLPIVVGGTGLYIKALIEPLGAIEIPPNRELRSQLTKASLSDLQVYIQKSFPSVWRILNESDRQNPRRLVRKIEIATYYRNNKNRKTTSDYREPQFDVLMIGLRAPFSFLYERIDARVDKRMAEGMLDEVKHIIQKGYNSSMPAMSSLGYKEWKPYIEVFDSLIDGKDVTVALKQQIINKWKFDEHKYARRQLTWFKKQKNICWFDITSPNYASEIETMIWAWYTK